MSKNEPGAERFPVEESTRLKEKSSPPMYDQAGVAMTCRSYDEYAAMFDLEEDSPLYKHAVLDVAGGASSFTAELSARGIEAVAVDPRYSLPPEVMVAQAKEEIRLSTEKLRAGKEHFDWAFYGSLSSHKQLRRKSLERFMQHYRSSAREHCYIPASLPDLPFADHRFGLVVCSHFLFLYGEQDISFYEQALRELIRVCRFDGEVRVYPLVSLPHFDPYPSLDYLLARLPEGVTFRLERTKLPFIPGSDFQLVMRKRNG